MDYFQLIDLNVAFQKVPDDPKHGFIGETTLFEKRGQSPALTELRYNKTFSIPFKIIPYLQDMRGSFESKKGFYLISR